MGSKHLMALFRIFSQKGWRRTGAINVIVAYVCAIILFVFFSISVSQSSLSRPTIIFEGNCTSSARLNFFFHLLINILSGVVLASSNFFMQVLTSPSREEIDEAHSWLRSLDIGIPSVKNLYHVSRFKSASWLVLFLSSIPIHLFFNSAIFQTLYMRSQWQLTLATEAFTKGAAFYPPGASLSPAGSAGPGYHWSAPDGYYEGPDLSDTTCSQYTSHGWLTNGYGTAVPLDDYSDATSVVRRNISSIAREAHSWTFLDAKKCQAEYMSCAPRVNYGDVVVVLDNGDSPGWPRSLVFDFDPNSNLTYWDTIVPPESANSLWFSAQCAVTRDAHSWDTAYCTKTCTGALGLDPPLSRYQSIPVVQEHWLLQFFPETRCGNTSLFGQGVTYNTAFDTLRVSHCLAQPTTPNCKIGLSNALLLVVIFCIFLKATQGAIVVWKLQHESLVTPGDAIQSFISHPDIFTRGLGTLDIVDSQHLEVSIYI
ncbi:hypothetical protein ANO14919_064850 [Xylariales sp. No.14919]|nr:hypothetical protein ANO14919_064850 [Xylariales sp. No.14919]